MPSIIAAAIWMYVLVYIVPMTVATFTRRPRVPLSRRADSYPLPAVLSSSACLRRSTFETPPKSTQR